MVIVQQVLRQTGGSGEIPSGGAVLDPYRWFCPFGDLLATSLAMVSPPFVSVPRRDLRTKASRTVLNEFSMDGPLEAMLLSILCCTPRA